MEENIRSIKERLQNLDLIVGDHFGWKSSMYDNYKTYTHKDSEVKVTSPYNDWIASITCLDSVESHLGDEMCSTTIRDKETDDLITIKKTLADVIRDIQGTGFEKDFRHIIMMCVYKEEDIKLHIRPLLIQLYG